jgi:hypothetical protein
MAIPSSALDWFSTGLRAANLEQTERFPSPQLVAHVTVENSGKQRFPVPCSLIDEIAAPPGQIYSHSEQNLVEMPKTASV